MFRFHKTFDIITLFHKANSPASTRIANLLRQVNANASKTTTMDQASDNAPQAHVRDEPFELNVTEDPPTADQLRTMLEYAEQSGEGEIAKIVEGANNVTQALKAFEKSKESFSRPVVVDWNNGKVAAGDNESKILAMLKAKT